ncbi:MULTISPECIES: hypothetical protein [unclassified Novosphingobium]|nr:MULTISPECIES: hypothetical protein [unclassified Novosphingobium]NKJ43672.1 hypothetical protein [Novosphingobium sp. SG720]NMN02971.1 hypothetical protein [Novosphingobium sp. SG919]NMN87042.1 hypothetical protein [Novosphingobium sp. SG916]
MGTWRDVKGDLLEMHRHRVAIAGWHDDFGSLAPGGQIALKIQAEDRR